MIQTQTNSLVVVFILLFSTTVFSQNLDVNWSHAQSKIDSLIEAYSYTSLFRGNILVYHEGGIKYNKSFGYANDDWEIPNSESTLFRLGSITKPITALGILTLIENEKLELHTKLSDLYDFDSPLNQITIEELLTHTSGLPQDVDTLETYDHHKFSRDEIISFISELSISKNKSPQFSYSNIGYYLLGDIIQLVSGQSYYSYLNKSVFIPSNMKNTVVDKPAQKIKNRATGYDDGPDNNGFATEVVADFIEPENDLGNGSLISSTTDLLNLYLSLKEKKVLKSNLLDSMFTAQNENYGYGWWVYNGEHKMIMHSGNISGFTSSILFYPDLDFVVILLANTSSVNGQSVSLGIRNLIFGREYYKPKIRNAISGYEFSREIKGVYENPYFNLELDIFDGRLYVKTPGDPWEELYAESGTYFFSKLHDFRISFADKKFNKGTLFFGDMEVNFTRQQ